ncbi:MAG: ROK family transcriptional regulator [Chloroflexota bacterium]
MLKVASKATRQQTKLHNSRLILKNVYARGPISRADISRLTNLTATTVSNIIAEQISEGLVEEVGSVSIERGKPPTLISIIDNARLLIALDLSRDDFTGAVMNLRGEILAEQSEPIYDHSTRNCEENDPLTTVYHLIDSLLSETATNLLGIGIGAPGIIDIHSGIVRHASNLGWNDLMLCELLLERYGLPTYIVNDNQAVLLAEHIFGNYEETPDLIVIRVGRGVGAGIMFNGQLVHGHGSGSGEIGHVVVDESGELCRCGNVGCLETVISRPAIVKRAQEIARNYPESRLNEVAGSPESVNIDSVIQAINLGDPHLTPLLQDLGDHLGVAIANLIGALGTPRILLCGSVAQIGQPLLDIIEVEVQKRTLNARINKPKIDVIQSKPNVVLLGAAASLLSNELGLF